MRHPDKHSPGFGGDRKSKKKETIRSILERAGLTEIPAAIVEKARIHPLDFMIQVVANDQLPLQMRLRAASDAMPYIAPRLAAQTVNVTNDFERLTEDQLKQRTLAVLSDLQHLRPDLRIPQIIEGEATRAVTNVSHPEASQKAAGEPHPVSKNRKGWPPPPAETGLTLADMPNARHVEVSRRNDDG